MNEDKLQTANQSGVRKALRLGGPLIGAFGLALIVVGVGSFFLSFGSFATPRYFWCAFLGMPFLFVGVVMCMFGYLGAVQRYMAGESAPVAKDAINYMGENVQPGVKAVAKAVTEGIIEAQKDQQQKT